METPAILQRHVEKLKLEPLLVKTPTPCAMEWSIDLEKGLRSKKPGQALEAILQSMQRLELWDRQPKINKAQCGIFKLVQGEDSLFATSILLRLVDAFSSGDAQIKLSVVKVFFSLQRSRRRKQKQSDGILFKCNLENRLEILRRVKVVFDDGDVENRAMALILFGCLADVAKDNADIRYLVLSSLVSSDMAQVQASLFAGGCFAELSNDFGLVLLEILVNMVTSPEISTILRVIIARVFAKLESSSSNASKSYKAGLKLVLGSSEEEFLIAMLMSLTKLAMRSYLLIPEQVSLLLSFLTQEKPLGLRFVALKCLYYVAARRIHLFPAHFLSIQTLVYIFEESDSPPALQCGALQILRKVFLYYLRIDAFGDILDLPNLFKILQNAAQSPNMTKRHISIYFLVDILSEFLVGNKKAINGINFITLASEVVSFLSHEIGLLVELPTDMEHKIKSLLSLLFVLFKRCSDLGPMVLERICQLIENMVNKHDRDVEMVESDAKSVKVKFFSCLSKFINSVLQNLNEAGTVFTEVLDRVELMIEKVYKNSSFDCFTRVFFSFSLHSQITNCCVSNEMEKNDNIDGYSSSSIQNYLIQRNNSGMEFANTILASKDSWSAYKLGRYAAHRGEWSTAAFIFENLEGNVNFNIHRMWFKSLIRFAHSEKILQLLKLPEIKSENVVKACNSLCSSKEAMTAILRSGCSAFFSRWFLDLRLKVLENIAETLKHQSLPISKGNNDYSGQGQNVNFTSLTCVFAQISSRFNRLAREYDMMATSFMGMDEKSLEIISENALSCSLLAFITGFSHFTRSSEDCLQGMLIQDLAWRLQHSDYEISTKFGLLLRFCRRPKSSLVHYTNQMNITSLGAIRLIAVCKYAISRVVIMQNEANGVNNDRDNLVDVSERCLQLLVNVVAKLVLVPFRTPNHFFRIRPCMSSELIVFSNNTRVFSKGISVLQGSQLTLDLCLQLRNTPKGLQTQTMKVYFVLWTKPSFQVQASREDDDDMIYANDRLFEYVRGSTQKGNVDGVIKTFARFELNEKGQGFSSCLFDVRGLSVGCYNTKWLSCCVDRGNYWSIIPSNVGPVFNLGKSHLDR